MGDTGSPEPLVFFLFLNTSPPFKFSGPAPGCKISHFILGAKYYNRTLTRHYYPHINSKYKIQAPFYSFNNLCIASNYKYIWKGCSRVTRNQKSEKALFFSCYRCVLLLHLHKTYPSIKVHCLSLMN